METKHLLICCSTNFLFRIDLGLTVLWLRSVDCVFVFTNGEIKLIKTLIN